MLLCSVRTNSISVVENRAIGIKTSGKESLRDGKSLQLSGHVQHVKYHGIGQNIPYSFICSEVVREVKISADPYKCWLIVHKEKSTVTEAFCSCPGGYVKYTNTF